MCNFCVISSISNLIAKIIACIQNMLIPCYIACTTQFIMCIVCTNTQYLHANNSFIHSEVWTFYYRIITQELRTRYYRLPRLGWLGQTNKLSNVFIAPQSHSVNTFSGKSKITAPLTSLSPLHPLNHLFPGLSMCSYCNKLQELGLSLQEFHHISTPFLSLIHSAL